MKISCPGCGLKFELSEATKDAAFRKILDLAHKFGPDSRLFFEYVECFRKGQKPLSPKMELRLLEEVFLVYEKGEFLFNRKLYHVSRPLLIEAVKIICNKQLNGLENHNYLKKILANNQERLEAGGERQEELRKRSPYRNLQEPSELEKISRAGERPMDEAGPHRMIMKDGIRVMIDANGEERIPMSPETKEALSKLSIGRKMPGSK